VADVIIEAIELAFDALDDALDGVPGDPTTADERALRILAALAASFIFKHWATPLVTSRVLREETIRQAHDV